MLSYFTYGLISSAFFALGALRYGWGLDFSAFCIFAWLMIFFLLMDLRYWRVPRMPASIGIIFGLSLGLARGATDFHERLLGSFFGFIFLWCLLILSTYVLRRTSQIDANDFAMGSGDPWLLAVIGAFKGILLVPGILFLASLQGLIAFLFSRLSKRFSFRPPWQYAHSHSVPFGTFLCLAALELAIWPNLMVTIMSFIRSLN